MNVWKEQPTSEAIEDSLAIHGAYYAMLLEILRGLGTALRTLHRARRPQLQSSPWRAEASPSDLAKAPDINIGTFSMDRKQWAHVVDPFMEKLRSFQIGGHRIDVRENVAFEGRGEQTRFIHDAFPKTGCAIAVEFKKFFMDEWTGLARQASTGCYARDDPVSAARP